MHLAPSIVGLSFGSVLLLTTAAVGQGRVLVSDGPRGTSTSRLHEIDGTNGSFIATIGPLNDSLGNNIAIGAMSQHPVTGVLYGTSSRAHFFFGSNVHLVTIDPDTAVVTDIGATNMLFGDGISDIAFRSDGTLLGREAMPLNNGGLYSIDLDTGAATFIGNSFGVRGGGLAFTTDGRLWSDFNAGRLRRIDPFTGAFISQLIASVCSDGSPGVRVSGAQGLNDSEVLVIERGRTGGKVYRINIDTGACTFLGDPGLDSVDGLVIFVADSDGDGFPDDEDACPNSDLNETVDIDGCDSGVFNHLLDDGCTISDLIEECAAGANNHGQFVSCVAQLTNALKQEGIISRQEKAAIQRCAGQTDIP